MVASKGFRHREILFRSVVIIDIVKITRVIIATQVWNNWWNT